MSARGSADAARDAAYLRIDRVTKTFGDFTAVRDVSLEVARGEVFCLLGGSGCGKTTLLRMLAGFEAPTEGRIVLDGVDVTALPPYERPINMMFQSYALFPHMTVEQNVAFGLKQDRLPAPAIRERVAELLALVQLEGFGARRPHQLSGGQRQRVALARALAKRPKLLLLDEPLGALDRKLRERTQFELAALQSRLGVTFVIVTHDQEEAMTLGTRLAVMRAGAILQVGTPTEVYEYPASRYVADFIGAVNLVDGRIVEDERDHVRVDCPALGIAVLVDHGIAGPPTAQVSLAIRPEKIRIDREPPAVTENVVEGRITEVAYLGDASRYLVRLASGAVLRATQPNAHRHESRLTRDARVWLHWEPSSVVVVSA